MCGWPPGDAKVTHGPGLGRYGQDVRCRQEEVAISKHMDRIGVGILLLGAIFGVLAVTRALDWPYAGVVCWVLLFVGIILRGLAQRSARRSDG